MLPQHFFLLFNGEGYAPHQIAHFDVHYQKDEDEEYDEIKDAIAVWFVGCGKEPFLTFPEEPQYQDLYNFLTNPQWTTTLSPLNREGTTYGY